MASRHLIDELRVECAFPDEASAFEAQADWEALVRRRLLEIANEVFDAVARPGEVRRYDRIEVDLGNVAEDSSTLETARRFRERLIAALQDAPHHADDAADADARVLSRGRSDLEQFQYFLVHGRLPWHAAGGGPRDPAELAEAVIRSHTAALAAWWRGAPDRERIAVRLVQQCGSTIADTLAASLAGLTPAAVGELAGLLTWSFTADGTGSLRSGLDVIARQAILCVALASGDAPPDDMRFARDACKRMARLLGVTHAGTAGRLREAVARLRSAPATSPRQSGMARALRAAVGLSAADMRAEPAANDPPEAGTTDSATRGQLRTDANRRWRTDLEHALLHGDGARIAAIWPMLVRDHGPMVVDVLRHRGRLARVRRRMASHLPESMLGDIAHLLEPGHGEFIEGVVRHPGWLGAQGAADTPSARRQLWTFALGHLLTARGARFDRGAFLASLVQQWAERDGLDAGPVLTTILAALDDVAVANALPAGAPQALRALARGYQAPERPTAADAIAAVDAYRSMADALLDADGGAPMPSGADITQFALRFPRQMARLHAALRAQSASGASIGALLDPIAREHLMAALAADLQADDLPLVLPGMPRTDATAFLPDAMPTSSDEIERCIARWLVRGKIDGSDGTWQWMVAERPAQLRAALRRLVTTKDAPRAIASVFTSPMVDDVVRLFAPAGSAFLSDVLRRPGHFDSGRGAGRHEQRARHLRTFTLAYLLAERGGAFNKRMYLGNLVRRMAAESNLHYSEVLAALVDALTGTPAASGAPREMLDLLRTLARDAVIPVSNRARARRASPRHPRESATPTQRTLHADAQRPIDARSRARPAMTATPRPGRAANADRHAHRPGSRIGVPPRPVTRPAVDPVVAELARIALIVQRPATAVASDAARADDRLRRLIQAVPTAARRLLGRLLEDSHAVARVVALFPEPTLARVMALVRPAAFSEVQRCSDIVATACLAAAPGLTVSDLRTVRWRFAFEHLVTEGHTFRLASFVRGLMARIEARIPTARLAAWRAKALQRLRSDRASADRGTVHAIVEALEPGGPASGETREPRWTDPAPATPGEALHVTNAGVVIAAPYLPRLFGMLGLLAGNAFVDGDAAARAVHVLQYLVDGSTDTPEHLLVLNKVLCGVPLDAPIARNVALTDAERTAVEGLLKGMIANWTAIGQTSVAGLRETFLQREGRLAVERDAWQLLVEPRAFDMLLDRLPWSISTLRLPWMDRVLHVDWR